MRKYINQTYVLKTGVEFRAPKSVVNQIYNEGKYITAGASRTSLNVFEYKNGKAVYQGTLASYIKPRKSGIITRYKDGNPMNCTYRNLV